MTCSACPSITAIVACRRSRRAACSGSASRRETSPRMQRAHDLAGLPKAALDKRAQARRIDPVSGGREQPAGELAHVPGQPFDPLELNHMRGLVKRNPAQEGVVIAVEPSPRILHVLGDEQQPRRALRAEQGEVVLTEHVPGGIADRETGFGSGGGTDDAMGHGSQRAGEAEIPGEALFQRPRRLRQHGERVARPFAAIDQLGRGRRGHRPQARVLGHLGDRPPARRLDLAGAVAARAGRRGRCRGPRSAAILRSPRRPLACSGPSRQVPRRRSRALRRGAVSHFDQGIKQFLVEARDDFVALCRGRAVPARAKARRRRGWRRLHGRSAALPRRRPSDRADR